MKNRNINLVGFNKDNLLTPYSALIKLGFKPEKANSKGYWILKCPFHKNGQERNPSFNLHRETGHYICFTCGKKGGSIINFYMKVTNENFFNAVRNLGAWD